MVVDDFDIERLATLPAKADAPLIVDTDTVLPRTIAAELFKPIARWGEQIAQVLCVVQIK